MKQALIFSTILVTLAACFKKPPDMHIPAPLQKILLGDTDCTCMPYLKEFMWKSQVVYLHAADGKGAPCNPMPGYYGLLGDPIEMGPNFTLDEFLRDAKPVVAIWKCGDPINP